MISLGAAVTPVELSLTGNFLAFALGLFLFSFGISLSAAAALGPDGVTALSLAAEKMRACPIPRATFLWNFTAIAAGVVLGGNFGAATLIGLFAAPVLILYFLKGLRPLVT